MKTSYWWIASTWLSCMTMGAFMGMLAPNRDWRIVAAFATILAFLVTSSYLNGHYAAVEQMEDKED